VEEWSDGSTGAPILLASFVFGSRLTPISQTKVTHDSNDQVTGTQTGLFLTDGHSGVRQVIDAATGAVILAQRYDGFGATVSTAGTFATPIAHEAGFHLIGDNWSHYHNAGFTDAASASASHREFSREACRDFLLGLHLIRRYQSRGIQ